MAVYGTRQQATDGDDITCAGCGSPLLSMKTVCPKCGGRARQPEVLLETGSPKLVPDARKLSVTGNPVSLGLIAVAVIAFFFAVITTLMGMVSPTDLFHSLMALAICVSLLALRQLLLR